MEPVDPRPIILNMGCGNSVKKSDYQIRWINLDMFQNPGVDVVANLEEGLAFADESIDGIFACHVMEHVHIWTKLMAECHRVLKPKGYLNIRYPDDRCRASKADPTHCNHFVTETWTHFCNDMEIGFDTLGMRKQLAFKMAWNELITHYRNFFDDGVPGNYYTEGVVDLVKQGPEYPWEKFATKELPDVVTI